jgi:enterochelin esterase-like enzyme
MSRRTVGIAVVVILVVVVGAAFIGWRMVEGEFGSADAWTAAATVPSVALGRDMPIEVFTPPGASSCPSAPVLVVFHGRGGDEKQWMGGRLLSPGVGVDALAHRLIDSDVIQPVTIVSASIDDSYGVDSEAATDGYDHGLYGRYVTDELLPAVVQRYGADGSRPLFVGGLSMGGYVALNVALDNPARFAGVGALSPAFFVSPPTERAWMYSANGHSSLFERAAAGAADRLRIFLGTGTADYQSIKTATRTFSDALVGRGVDVAAQATRGGHEVDTWRALAEPMLRKLFARDATVPC